MLPIEATRKEADVSSSIQATYQYAWSTDFEYNQESQAADCSVYYSSNVSLTNLMVSCSFGGETK
jgi:hypothetical protein